MKTLRCFIAIELDPATQQALHHIQTILKETAADVKWVAPENLHVTLKFLGDISEYQVEQIKAALPKTFSQENSFPVRINSLGSFPDAKHPKVLWAGIEQNAERVKILAGLLEEMLSKMGFPKETREFSAHITIGRSRSDKNIAKLMSLLEQTPLNIEQRLRKIVFFQSTLTPQGSIYQILSEVVLN